MRVAVLGAGILGATLAVLLARSRHEVTVLDQAPVPVAGASRWNEGKLHLGYLYSADPSGTSARAMIEGGLAFASILREVTGQDLASAVSPEPDLYLVHAQSIVSADDMGGYFRRLDDLLRAGPGGYVGPIRATEALTRAELDRLDAGQVVAGFRVPERSVNTQVVADQLAGALLAEPRVTVQTGTHITGLEARRGEWQGPWTVRAGEHRLGPFDAVVNALWEGRLAIDRAVGLAPAPGWSHRYRACLFVRTRRPVDVPNQVVAVGAFGDIKNYDGRNFYLSWYPAGLLAEGEDVAPPALPGLDEAALVDRLATALRRHLPSAGRILDAAERIAARGGWVFAQGRGALDDRAATIHRRDRFGILHQGSYWSVDTGKYSTAPWLARQVHARLGADAPH